MSLFIATKVRAENEKLAKMEAECEKEASIFNKWANKNKKLAFLTTFTPVGAYAAYTAYKYPALSYGERFSKTGVLGQGAALVTLIGVCSVVYVWQPKGSK